MRAIGAKLRPVKAPIVAIGLIFSGLVLGALLDRLPFARRAGLALVFGALTFILDVNLAFHPSYRGMSRSFDVGTTTMLIVALTVLTLLAARRFGWEWFPPSRPVSDPNRVVVFVPWLFSLLAFVGYAALTITVAKEPGYAMMDLFKYARGVALFWLVVNLVRDDDIVERLPMYALIYVIIEVAVVGSQFLRGFWWIPGTFTHKNSFALSTNILLPLILVAGMNDKAKRMPLYLMLYCAGAASLILSRSRMGWFTMTVSAGIVVAASFVFALRSGRRQQVGAQFLAIAVMVLLAMPLLVQMADGIISRMGEDRKASMDFRHTNNHIATTLANRNPIGVGINNYVVELQEPIGRALPELDRTVAHHLYLLLAAELGWPGLVLFIVILAQLWGIGLYTLVAARRPYSRLWTFGLLVGLMTCHLHSFLEADLVRRETWFIFCVSAGMIVGIHQREGLQGYWGLYRALKATRVSGPALPPPILAHRAPEPAASGRGQLPEG